MVYRMRVLNWSVDTTLFRHLTDQMLRDGYEEAQGVGFLIDHCSRELIEGRFIVRRHLTDVVMTPTGTEESYERVEYETTEFLAAPGPLGLCLTNPPRSNSIFALRLVGLALDRLSVEDAEVRLNDLRTQLELSLGPATVRSVRFSGVSLDDQVTATVAASGRCRVVENAIQWVGSRAYRLDKLNLDFTYGGESLRILATSSGTIGLNRWPSSDLKAVVWEAIRHSSQSSRAS